MAIICWGNLAKSADSTERIEESIQGYIETHDENPNAHMGPDYALGVHRLEAVMDHVKGSVQLSHLAMDSVFSLGSFETFDGFITAGYKEVGILGSDIYTDDDGDISTAYLYPPHYGDLISFNKTKNPFFQTTLQIPWVTNMSAYFGLGAMKIDDIGHGLGFKCLNSNLYAVWWESDVEKTHLLSGIDPSEKHCYRVYIDSTAQIAYFVIDGVAVHNTSTVNMDDNVLIPFNFWVHRSTDSMKLIYLLDWLFQQDR